VPAQGRRKLERSIEEMTRVFRWQFSAIAVVAGLVSADLKLRPCEGKDALGTSRELVVNAPKGGLHLGLESYNKTLALKPNEVVLTFDDGPNPGTTERVLDALKAECVQATFFLIGRNAQAHPQLVKREIRDGHTIGSHTWSHPVRTLAGIPESDAIEEIKRGFAAVDRAGYDMVIQEDMPKTSWFRFPGFADTKETLDWLDKRRITVFGTDFWAADWVAMSPEEELNRLMKHLRETGGGIVLLHDTRSQTAKMLPTFLRELKDRGYEIVHIVAGDPSQTPLRDAGPGWKSETKEIVAKLMPRLLNLPPYTPDGGGEPALK
jgi:peptidoglycan/xylan/chitin deacetylase (PgdA/CDA1 family)